MSNLQRRALEELGDQYVIPFQSAPVDLGQVVGREKVIVEIGFGMGLATARIAEEHPDTGFIGIEVHPPGVGKLLSEIQRRHLDNLRIIHHDAMEVFRYMIPDNVLEGIHIFFPDPWPKKKHHKRRLIQPGFAGLMTAKLKTGGYIHAATDWEEYAFWILRVFSDQPRLRNRFDRWADSTLLRPETKFERKGIAQEHIIRDICFERVR